MFNPVLSSSSLILYRKVGRSDTQTEAGTGETTPFTHHPPKFHTFEVLRLDLRRFTLRTWTQINP